MAQYTLVGSRDPFTGDGFEYSLATTLAEAGHEVALFLVDNGVFAARAGAGSNHLKAATAAGVSVFADSFALDERGITPARRDTLVKAVSLEVLVDHMASGRNITWH